jgi:hypothetical protein
MAFLKWRMPALGLIMIGLLINIVDCTSSLNGNWQMGGPYNAGQSCQIIQQENSLTFINENGQRSSGWFIDSSTVIANDWDGGLQGTISADGSRIDWANGTWWIRSSAFNSDGNSPGFNGNWQMGGPYMDSSQRSQISVGQSDQASVQQTSATLGESGAVPDEGSVILDNGNIGSVDNGPICSPVFTLEEPQRITYLETYHWNYGQGSPAGTISLRRGDGTLYGPWAVETRPGQGGVPNAYWTARPNSVLSAGTYTVEDSDPSTWSQNSQSGGCGFCKVMAVAVATGEVSEETGSPIFENGNIGSVNNGPFCNPSFTIYEPHMITYLETYHWNFGYGTAAGGTVALRKDDGTELGPWQTETRPGQGGVPNAYWMARPSVVIPAGTYQVIDSDPETWSQNAESGGCRFCKVEGRAVNSTGGSIEKPEEENGERPGERSRTIGPEGGSIVLSDGIRIVVPEGAVSQSTQFSVKELDPKEYLDDDLYDGAVLEVRASADQFSKPIEIRVPLPSYITSEDTSAICGTIDEETGIPVVESARLDDSGGRLELVLLADHFSTKFFQWIKQSFGQEPFSSDPLPVPYYDQGKAPFCWAASTLMVCQAVNYKEDAQVFHVIGKVGISGDGLKIFQGRFGGPLNDYIKGHSGQAPTRKLWTAIDSGMASAMRSYIRRELACNHNPVMVFSSDKRHAWVITGYDGDKFYVHDSKEPLVMPPYSLVEWEGRLAGLFKGDTGLVTVVIPADIRSSDHLITAGINNGGVIFRQPSQKGSEDANYVPNDMLYSFQWDYKRPEGYGFIDGLGKAAEKLPADIDDVRLSENGICIANADRNSAHDVLVSVDIVKDGDRTGRTEASRSKRMTIPAASVTYLSIDPIKCSDFQEAGAENYRFRVTIYDQNKQVVETGFDFVIETGQVKIKRPLSETEKGVINYDYNFSAYGSSIPDDARYEWNFDDGSQEVGKDVTHRFAEPRPYRVKVRATWNGGSGEDETVFEIAPDQTVEAEEVTFYVFRTVKPLGKDPTTGQPWKAEKQACNDFTLTLLRDGKALDMGVGEGEARGTNGVLTLSLLSGDYGYEIAYSYPRPQETGKKSGTFRVTAGGRNMVEVETSQVSPDLGTSDGGRSVDSGQSVDSGRSVDSGVSVDSGSPVG